VPIPAGPAEQRGSPRAADLGVPQGYKLIPLTLITPNSLQPRKNFDEGELSELRLSIRENGLLQPLVVRPRGSGYELVAGERRLRAMQSLGWREAPAHVRDLDDQSVLTLALIENLQRADLNPIEEAEGYQELIARFELTQQQVADAVGRERSTVANMLRLLALPDAVRALVRKGDLSLGHARALLGLNDPARMEALARAVIAEGLTVREVERRVRETSARPRHPASRPHPQRPERSAELRAIEEQLRRRFQTDARVLATDAGKGEVHLSFYSADDLERLLDLLLGPGREAV
jgi:ParB family chromosome partitioning protein